MGTTAPIGAQAGAPARADTAAATANISPGIATAGGSLLGVIPGVSGLTLTTTYGEATAAYEVAQSEATSATVDMGGLGYLLANEQTCGNSFPEKDLPQPLTANSGAGSSTKTGGYGAVGAELVSVSEHPEEAHAITSVATESLTGILSVAGQSTASVHYVEGTEQQADSTVTEDIEILGGIVDLKGVSWTASWRSGATTSKVGNFTLGQVTINHVPLSAGTPPTVAIAAINTAISPLGFTLTPSSTKNNSTAVAVAPMVLRFSGSSIERAVLNPAVGPVTQLEGEINAASQPGSDCSKIPQLMFNIGNNLNGDVNLALAIGQGTGSLSFALGGANAGVSNLPSYTNPFGNADLTTSNLGGGGGGVLPPTVAQSSSPPVSSGAVNAAVGGAPSGPSAPSAGAPSPAAPAASQTEVPAATSVVCQTTSPAGSPGCWRGAATIAAAVLVAGGTGVFAADIVYGRRRRRRRRSLEERRAAL